LPKLPVSRLIPVFVESASSKIEFNGQEYATPDEMPPDVRLAYDRAVHGTAVLHSGARLAAKLNAKIIVNDAEFTHAGEMSVDDRHHYHEALEALFPPGIAVSVGGVDDAEEVRPRKMWLILLAASVLAGAAYLWLHSLFA
jgi:hypothetical protein